MKELLNKISQEGIVVDVKDGQLQLFSTKDEVDQDLISEIKNRKTELLAYLTSVNKSSSGTGKFEQIPQAEPAGSYPLSSAQLRLWLASQFEVGDSVFNVQKSNVLNGELNVIYFKKAINSVLQRHEILRTIFRHGEDGKVRQFILPPEELNFSVKYLDLSDEPESDQKCDEYIFRDAKLPFDLAKGPLIRAMLIKVGEEQHVFYYNMHHIITDQHSSQVIAQDTMSYYTAYMTETTPQLPELRIQYKDYAVWQSRQVDNENYINHKNYWMEKLSGELPVIDLPSLKQRPSIKTNKGRQLNMHTPEVLSDAIHDYVRQQESSLYIFLITSINVLLYKYTSSRDIIIGSPFGGRFHPDLENQIGFYTNNLAIRNMVDPNLSFNEFHNQVKKSVLLDFEHQDYPFDKLVGDLDVEFDASRSTIYDISLTLHKEQDNNIVAEIFSIGKVREREGFFPSKNDIEFHFTAFEKTICFDTTFNNDVYEAEMISKMKYHFVQLLESLLANPDQALNTISYLTEEEVREQLETLNDSKVDYPTGKTMIDVFTEQVLKTPDASALVFENVNLTYQQLDTQSSQFANCLTNNYKIKKGDFVALHLDRYEQYIVCMLGVLKAGAVYVPIDVNYPVDRKAFIVKDADIQLMVTDSNYMFDLDYYEGAILAVDIEFNAEEHDAKVAVLPDAQDLAYVIYTSGSTGIPKGVLIAHGAILNTIFAQIDIWGIKAENRCLQFASFSFDASISEIFIALLSGASLYLLNEKLRNDPLLLAEYIEANQVDVATLPPAYFNKMDVQCLKDFKVLITAGELPDTEKIRSYLQYERAYFNAYGPTETSICASMFEMAKDTKLFSRTIPIGVPISNVEIYILDEFNNLKPKGAIGEICVGGPGLSSGYLKRPELTAEKFIPHPFKDEGRLYKTGDLGCWLPDGTIEFKGRKDHQIKLNGYRIELGEIESALNELEDIHKAVALIKTDKLGDKKLIAYVVWENERDAEYIRKSLGQRLPEYMVPKIVVSLSELPVNHNGKIDRKALPNPDSSAYSRTAYIAPTSQLEIQIVNVWQEVLGIDKIGVNDNFFELGGDSLKAITLTGQYVKLFNKKITINNVFAAPILKEHVNLIDESSELKYVAIPKVEPAASYPLSNAQHRLWIESQMEEVSVTYNMPNHLVLDDSFDLHNFQKAIHAVIDRHEILRTVFRMDDAGEIMQFILSPEELDFSVEKMDCRKEENPQATCEAMIAADISLPFDLEKGPLFRAVLYQLTDEVHVFYYNMHHIISDRWSMDVLSRDIMKHYDAYQNNIHPELPFLEIQYKDYSVWQQEQLSSDQLSASKEYWVNLLSPKVPKLNLPAFKRRPNVKTHKGKKLGTLIAKEPMERLRSFTNEKGGSLFTGLSAICTLLIHKYTNENDIVIGTPVVGRDHPGLSDQIGFYVNTLALRHQIDPEKNFIELFDLINQNTLKAYEHQAFPFDLIVEELRLTRDTSRSPVFDLLINYHGTSNRQPYEYDERGIADLGNNVSKFDVEFDFTELAEGVDFVISYNHEVYDTEMISQLMLHYKSLLSALLDNQEQKLATLDYLPETHKQTFLSEYNQTKTEYPKDKTTLDLILQHTITQPESIALALGASGITYQELEEKSAQVAANLIRCGVEKNTLVPIYLERSMEMIVALLGVLRTGAAYVPIDTNYPDERVRYILKDTNAQVVLTQSDLIEELQGLNQEVKYVKMDGLEQINRSEVIELLEPINVTPDQLAYIIYTSGTTGLPKGVMISHFALFDYINTFVNYFQLNNSDKVLQQSSIAFDVSIEEIFPILSVGGQLHIADMINDFEYLINTCSEQSITLLSTHPYLIQYLNDSYEGPKLNLRILISGGDVLKKEQISNITDQYNIYNTYGPTESTVCISYAKIESADQIISIGKPIANRQVYILSDDLQLQPIGVAGELCVGGNGLANGYLNLRDLSDEKFINHPFVVGEKLYKTGDQVRWLPNGTIEFLGRKDQQVKILGNRIELGEIEFIMNQITGIRQAVVTVREDERDNKHLVAFVVAEENLDQQSALSTLKAKLPQFMIPRVFVPIESVPLTPNGKIDFKALPTPKLEVQREYIAPTTETEIQLAKIWEDVLSLDQVSMQDNFFDLGGNSITAVKIILRIRKEMNFNLDIKTLFEVGTIADLAHRIEFQMKREALKSNSKIVKQIL